MVERKYDLIISIVKRGYSDFVVDAARDAGATGGTIVHGRGTGIHEKQKFLGISLQPEKEMVLILVDRDKKVDTMKAICDRANFDDYNRGICFSVPVNDVMGMSYLTAFANKEVLDEVKLQKGVIDTVQEQKDKDHIKAQKLKIKAEKEAQRLAKLEPKPEDISPTKKTSDTKPVSKTAISKPSSKK